jgi:hypothetical protein
MDCQGNSWALYEMKRRMINPIGSGTIVFATISLMVQLACADSFAIFDYNELSLLNGKAKDNFANVEKYMEGVYGSDIAVGSGVRVSQGFGGPLAISSDPLNLSLINGPGKNSNIVLNFNSAPINSFAVDLHLFKRARGITILGDGEVIYQHFLTKEEKKKGVLSHLGPYFLDHPVHNLEFRASKRSRFSLDNLAINFPDPNSEDNGENGAGNPDTYPGGIAGGEGPIYNPTNPPTQLPVPSSLLILATGLFGLWVARHQRKPNSR